jgi:hypothetical protein
MGALHQTTRHNPGALPIRRLLGDSFRRTNVPTPSTHTLSNHLRAPRRPPARRLPFRRPGRRMTREPRLPPLRGGGIVR